MIYNYAFDVAENDKENDSRSAQANQTAIQRRRRPKRRSTGVVHVDMDVSFHAIRKCSSPSILPYAIYKDCLVSWHGPLIRCLLHSLQDLDPDRQESFDGDDKEVSYFCTISK